MLVLVRHQFDQFSRAYINTLAAGLTSFLVYNSYPVYNMDCIKLTGLHTGPFSQTTESTGLWSVFLHHIDHNTVMEPFVIIALLCHFTSSCTFDKGNLSHLFSGIHTHDLTDLGSYRSSSYRAGIHRRFSCSDRSRKPGTSRISTS